MAKFITGIELEKIVYDIIWDANETLLIVSPFIKLDNYFVQLFDKHLNNPKLHIIIVFGKNEENISRSLSNTDFEYFKKFPNISIIYVHNLHAKYYGNEKKGVITSINLIDYSFKNNIEFGVFSETNFLNNFTTTSDTEAWQICKKIAEDNEVIFIKRPVVQKKILSALLGKNYLPSKILFDLTDEFNHQNKIHGSNKKLKDFPDQVDSDMSSIPRPERNEIQTWGYCIRTCEKIPFNPKRPFCESAYRSWAQYSNVNYPEKYCHKTGKQSYGKTSMQNPILN